MKKILIKIWMPADNMKDVAADDYNFGDRIGDWIIEQMGHEPVLYGAAEADGTLDEFDSVLHPLGSTIGQWPEIPARLVRHYWGCGYNNRSAYDPTKQQIHSVRGPMSRAILKLEHDLPIGDTGLLVGKFLNLEKTGDEGVLWTSHLQSEHRVTEDFLDDIVADNTLRLLIKKDDFEPACQRIKNARMLISSALHPVIVAASLGVPFAFAFPPGTRPEFPLKYIDFCESIGIPFIPVRTLKQAEERLHWNRYQ